MFSNHYSPIENALLLFICNQKFLLLCDELKTFSPTYMLLCNVMRVTNTISFYFQFFKADSTSFKTAYICA